MWLEHCVKVLHHVIMTPSGQSSCRVLGGSVSTGRGLTDSCGEMFSKPFFNIVKYCTAAQTEILKPLFSL